MCLEWPVLTFAFEGRIQMKLDKTSAAKLTSIALCAFLLGSCNEEDLKDWLASTPIYPPMACPLAPLQPAVPSSPPGATLHTVPFFEFPKTARTAIETGKLLSCTEDGPYRWHDTQWYVQRIDFYDDKGVRRFAARVCSLDAVPDKYGPALDLVVETPGGPVERISPTKCQLVESY